jgi:hypothetical protein
MNTRQLERLSFAEYKAQLAAHVRRGRKESTFRYSPPGWHRDAVSAIGRRDEETYKRIVLDKVCGY